MPGKADARAALTREAILAADDLKLVKVDVPEWGGIVYVRSMTGAERDDWELTFLDATGKVGSLAERSRNLRAKLAVATVVDAAGKRIFRNEDAADLGAKAIKPLNRIWSVSSKLNGITEADVTELVGN